MGVDKDAIDTDGSSLGAFETALAPDAAIDRLEALAKRGKLPGFERTGEGACRVAAHGTPFDGTLGVACEGDGTGSRVTLHHGLNKRMPLIYAAILVVVVWPGVVLTETFLTGFGWYNALAAMTGPVEPWFTWAWYVPMTALPAPFMLRSAWRKSVASSGEHAEEQAQKIRSVLLED